MNLLKRLQVWISRIHRCCGFGIQSPTDYAFVRYVINEHWPYYAYSSFTDDDWLTQKLGKLYFRLANWRQPSLMLADRYQQYFHAGCQRITFTTAVPTKVELARVDVEDRNAFEALLPFCDAQSIIVMEGISRDKDYWRVIEKDGRTGTTFDLYYCGIIFFDIQRYKHNYQINF